MTPTINLYIDDSGSRHPDHPNVNIGSHGYDWFSLGGVLILEEDEDSARAMISAFKDKWPQIGDSPLHSSEIRHKSGAFRWLLSLSTEDQARFMADMTNLVIGLPVHGLACVINRPGYNNRYEQQYGRKRWQLCKTAFCILVERSTKHAISNNRKLRVFAERCSKRDDQKLKEYYDDLKNIGHPFSSQTADIYEPLTNNSYNSTLYEFKLKYKSSPIVQIADIYLWAISIGGYDPRNRAYLSLMGNGKLLNSVYQDDLNRGIKYFCFD